LLRLSCVLSKVTGSGLNITSKQSQYMEKSTTTSKIISIRDFDKIFSKLTDSQTPHNYLLNFHLHRMYAFDYIADKDTSLKIIDDLDEETPVCERHRFEGKSNNEAGLEDKIWAWTYPFVYQIDNWSGITLTGELLSFVKPVGQTKCQYCDSDADLVLIKTRNAKDPRISKRFDNINSPAVSSQIELESFYEHEVQTGKSFSQYEVRKNGKPIKVLSFGCGKDSMTEFVLNWFNYDLIIFADTGSEQPETYEYLQEILTKMPIEARARFIVLSENYLGKIYDFYYNKKLIPMPYSKRDCTDKFKIIPIRHFLRGRETFRTGLFQHGNTYEMHICINASEADRARGSVVDGRTTADSGVKYIKLFYPLIDKNIKRDDESKIIMKAGYNVPVKSGCFMCPFTTKQGFQKLGKNHPKLLQKVIDLQNNSTARLKILKIEDGQSLDEYFEKQNKKTVENRCSCFNGVMATEEEIMTKTNKW